MAVAVAVVEEAAGDEEAVAVAEEEAVDEEDKEKWKPFVAAVVDRDSDGD